MATFQLFGAAKCILHGENPPGARGPAMVAADIAGLFSSVASGHVPPLTFYRRSTPVEANDSGGVTSCRLGKTGCARPSRGHRPRSGVAGSVSAHTICLHDNRTDLRERWPQVAGTRGSSMAPVAFASPLSSEAMTPPGQPRATTTIWTATMTASPAGALSWSVDRAATYRKSGSCPTCRSTWKTGLAAALCRSCRIADVTLDGPPRSCRPGWLDSTRDPGSARPPVRREPLPRASTDLRPDRHPVPVNAARPTRGP